jgi:hypothetical protein
MNQIKELIEETSKMEISENYINPEDNTNPEDNQNNKMTLQKLIEETSKMEIREISERREEPLKYLMENVSKIDVLYLTRNECKEHTKVESLKKLKHVHIGKYLFMDGNIATINDTFNVKTNTALITNDFYDNIVISFYLENQNQLFMAHYTLNDCLNVSYHNNSAMISFTHIMVRSLEKESNVSKYRMNIYLFVNENNMLKFSNFYNILEELGLLKNVIIINTNVCNTKGKQIDQYNTNYYIGISKEYPFAFVKKKQ